ncbi:MAG TPA: 50S ribosomal protein L6 [Lentisphaeria bacterium]|nr:MAG: 50S ribosomal protein L6 [Lentisphaerae bacterium GWF2_38_69]HBM16291.1 50S ribosomal protein L6 [Lentisphaeria bacterium]
MSRIGKKPIAVPAGVKITVANGQMTVENGKNVLTQAVPPEVKIAVEDNEIIVSTPVETKRSSAMQGLTRSLLAGMVEGVTKGFKKNLEIVGVGYKAKINGNTMELALGFSHPVVYNVPQGIKVTVADNTKISVEGINKQLVGQVAANIRRFKKPEPYKGKGIRYAGEHIVIKEGKAVG